MAFETEILLLIVVSALVIYLIVTQEYVPIRERPQRKTFGRDVINYYGWKGPFFIDDFAKFESDAKAAVDERRAIPLGQVETFGNFFGPNNPLDEIVPVQRPNPYLLRSSKDECAPKDACVFPKYNTNNEKVKKCHALSKKMCMVPTYNSEDSWRNEYWNSIYKMRGPSGADGSVECRSPDWSKGDAGNYLQMTNNNLDISNNLKCQSRGRDMDYCACEDKVSPVCYAMKMSECLTS